MNLQRTVKPYEILFRLSPSGTIVGCHKRELETITDMDTGSVYSNKELDPVPITGEYITAIIGTINASLVQTLTAKDVELQVAAQEKEELQQQLSVAASQVDQLQSIVAAVAPAAIVEG